MKRVTDENNNLSFALNALEKKALTKTVAILDEIAYIHREKVQGTTVAEAAKLVKSLAGGEMPEEPKF